MRFAIRGQEIDVDPEQLFAPAQKNAAGDDYLREARATLDAAKAQGLVAGRGNFSSKSSMTAPTSSLTATPKRGRSSY